MNEFSSTKPRRLVVGASGQVGSQFLLHGSKVEGQERTLATSRFPVAGWLQLNLAELTQPAQAGSILDRYPLSSIYCIGGMTHVDACEDAEELAWRTNAQGPAVLASYARHHGIPFVYFSTEYIFDGSSVQPGPYLEDSKPNPLNAYGRSKLEGERMVLEAYPDALVLRTTVVYGADPGEKNYLYSLMRNLSSGVPMRVPEDQVSTPTYNRDLVLAALGLVEARASGVFHVCGPELLGRLEFATAIATQLGLDAELLQGVATSELRQRAQRPLQAGLSSNKLVSAYPHLHMRTVAEGLEDCVLELREYLQRSRSSKVETLS